MTITIAIVNDYIVSEVVSIDDSEYQSYASSCQIAVDITNANPQPQAGWLFDGSKLNPPPGASVSVQITKLAFRERFTSAELIGIIEASQQTNSLGYTLQMMLQNQMISAYIDLSRSDTIAGVEFLVSQGLLTSARATAILTTPPTQAELYQG